jgi:hypothetical protein
MLLKNFPCALVFSVNEGFAKQTMLSLLILYYSGSLTAFKFKPVIFSMSDIAWSYAVRMFIVTILHGFYLSPAQFCYVIIYIPKVKQMFGA